MIGRMTSKSVPQIQPLTRARKKSQRSPKEVRIFCINVSTPEGKLFFNFTQALLLYKSRMFKSIYGNRNRFLFLDCALRFVIRSKVQNS